MMFGFRLQTSYLNRREEYRGAVILLGRKDVTDSAHEPQHGLKGRALFLIG